MGEFTPGCCCGGTCTHCCAEGASTIKVTIAGWSTGSRDCDNCADLNAEYFVPLISSTATVCTWNAPTFDIAIPCPRSTPANCKDRLTINVTLTKDSPSAGKCRLAVTVSHAYYEALCFMGFVINYRKDITISDPCDSVVTVPYLSNSFGGSKGCDNDLSSSVLVEWMP